MCLLGPGLARHIKFQAEVRRIGQGLELSLARAPYRFRTVEAALKLTPRSAPTVNTRRSSRTVRTIRLEARRQG